LHNYVTFVAMCAFYTFLDRLQFFQAFSREEEVKIKKNIKKEASSASLY